MFWINQANAALDNKPTNGISWLGLDRPAANCLMPFYCRIAKLPKCVGTMNLLDFNFKSAWWAFNFVANYATLKYSYMLEDIETKRQELENKAYDWVKTNEKENDIEVLTKYCAKNAKQTRDQWWDLAKQLIIKYNNGCRTEEDEVMAKIDYPSWWLRDSGYNQGPISYNKTDCREHKFKR